MVSLDELIGDKLNSASLILQSAVWSTMGNAMVSLTFELCFEYNIISTVIYLIDSSIKMVVISNNLYYMAYIGAQLMVITKDGVPGLIYNGIPDWFYSGTYLLYMILNNNWIQLMSLSLQRESR